MPASIVHNLPASAPGNTVVSVTKRLQNELMQLMTANCPGISAFPQQDNLFHWIATISGPPDTPYQGLTYKLTLTFPETYPFEPPRVLFQTPIFHPNVDAHGHICLDILKDKWSAVYSVQTVLLSIQSLLEEPNNNSPLNAQAAELWVHGADFRNVVLTRTPGIQTPDN